jgi:hypothetical protein
MRERVGQRIFNYRAPDDPMAAEKNARPGFSASC